jgi:2-methylisocitrate lyase-like PEP mutase family enzyme
MIFPEAMQSLDDYRRFKAAVKMPILANLIKFGSTPFFITSELRDADVDIALYCCGAYRALNAAASNFCQTMMRDDTQKAAVPTMQTRADPDRYLGYYAHTKTSLMLVRCKHITRPATIPNAVSAAPPPLQSFRLGCPPCARRLSELRRKPARE